MKYVFALAVVAGLTSAASAEPPRELRARVQKAIDALKQRQHGDGSFGASGAGSTSLAGLALIESGVPKDDPAIQAAIGYVRPISLRSRLTYSVALSIIFLDRVGDPEDVALIQLLTRRLLEGQNPDAGWTHFCPLGDISSLAAKFPEKPTGRTDGSGATRVDTVPEAETRTDNFDSQFAILALWVGHRHGVDVERCLFRVEELYIRSIISNVDGAGWDYRINGNAPSLATTCCGMLGIAASSGIKIQRRLQSGPPTTREADLPVKRLTEWQVQQCFRFLTKAYGDECSIAYNIGSDANVYFLWSFERVVMTYGSSHLGGYDWFNIGLQRMLPYQRENGLWGGHYGPESDTSYALLFLSRANLSRDLTDLLKPKKAAKLKTEPKAAAPFSPEAEKLIQEFFAAPASERPQRLAEYRDKKGVAYTEALAGIIAKIDPDLIDSARQMLAERLARMTAATLADYLKDPDVELRRAAATAAALKGEKALIPDLIARLDGDSGVALAAMTSLKQLTGEDHGPPAQATPEQITQAVAAWKEWWRKKQP